MPWFITALLGGVRFLLSSWVLQVLLSLGIAVVTYTGVDASLDWYVQHAQSSLSGLPAEVLGALGFMRVGEAVGIVVAAMAMRLTMLGVKNAAGALAIRKFIKG